MNDLLRTIHLAATGPHFRARLLADPRAATASQGLTLSDEELAVLTEMRHLFARHPATWLSGPSDPMGIWFGGRPVTHAALA